MLQFKPTVLNTIYIKKFKSKQNIFTKVFPEPSVLSSVTVFKSFRVREISKDDAYETPSYIILNKFIKNQKN